MYLGYLWDRSDNPEDFLVSCSKSERDVYFNKFRLIMQSGVTKDDDMLKMCEIGFVFHKLGYFE